MHRQSVAAVATTMHYVDNDVEALHVPPAGVSQQEWDSYLYAVRTSWAKLQGLRTGLDPWRGSAEVWSACTNGHSEKFDSRENLSKLSNFRMSEFKYALKREYSTGCGLVPLDANEQWRAFGTVASWHAGNVDNLPRDIVLYFRPTNALGLGLARKFLNDAFAILGGSIIAPFYCAWGFLSGDGCDLKKPFTVARRYDPVQAAFDLVPGFGEVTGNDYNGLWHYFDSAYGTEPRSGVPWEGSYNDVPGMYYAWAGPENVPGVIDVGIMIAADASGLSVNADESRGIGRYAKYDAIGRSHAQWQGDTLSRTEFSPVDNLARYGWEEYKKDPTAVKYLGWPLHALGDSAMPEHIAPSTSWGHRPVEDAMDRLFAWGLGLDTENDEMNLDGWYKGGTGQNLEHNGVDSVRQILAKGYDWLNSWKDIQDTVHRLAAENHDIYYEYRLIYDDVASLSYQVASPLSDDAKEVVVNSMIYRPYTATFKSLDEIIRAPTINSMGAMLAFLMKASDIAKNTPDASIYCPEGQKYVPNGDQDGSCQSTAPVFGPPISLGDGFIAEIAPGGTGEECTRHNQCLSNRCVRQAGQDKAYCAPGEQGDTCHKKADCASDYVCLNGECAYCTEFDCNNARWPGSACTGGFQCMSSVCKDGVCGKNGPELSCRTEADCSSDRCDDGVCLDTLPAGAYCASNAQCVTQKCSNGTCAKSDYLGPCRVGSDCVTDLCQGNMCDVLR
jgi:hypothetical protein